MARKTAQSFADMPTVRFGEDEEGAFGIDVEFSGYYKGSKEVETKKYGKKLVYTFQTEDGDVQIWGSANLNQKMQQVNIGALTFITYKGEQKSKERGKNPTKIFNVEYDDAETIEVEQPKVNFRDDSDDQVEDDVDMPEDDDQAEEEQEEEQPKRSASAPKPGASKPGASKPAGNAAASGDAKARLKDMLNKNKRPAA